MNIPRLMAFLTFTAVVVSNAVVAKPQTLRWQTDACMAKATYDDTKFSGQQLKQTLDLLSDGLIDLYDDTATQAQNDSEHAQVQAVLQQPNHFINHPIINTMRERAIQRDQFFYDLTRTIRTAKQTHQYTILNDFMPAQTPSCQAIAQIIQSPASEEKTAAASKILTDGCQKNAEPNDCVTRSLTRWSQSDDAMNVGLLAYHWHNCANHQQPEISPAEREAAIKIFKQSVGKILYYDCEEP